MWVGSNKRENQEMTAKIRRLIFNFWSHPDKLWCFRRGIYVTDSYMTRKEAVRQMKVSSCPLISNKTIIISPEGWTSSLYLRLFHSWFKHMLIVTGLINQEQLVNMMNMVRAIQTLRAWACWTSAFTGSLAGHMQSAQSLCTVRLPNVNEFIWDLLHILLNKE